MDVNKSNCIYCKKEIHYSEARLLPEGGGVCHACAQKRGYRPCDECQDWFISDSEETFCDDCLERLLRKLN